MKRKLLTSVGCVSMIAILFLIYNVNFSGGGVNFFQSTGLPYETKVDEELDKNEIPVYDYCYYDLTEDGDYITNPEFKFDKFFSQAEKTAVLIIDPWIDNPFDEVNKQVEKIISDYILSIAQHAIEKEMMVFIISNKPGLVEYNSNIDTRLQKLIDEQKAELLVHDEFNCPDKLCV